MAMLVVTTLGGKGSEVEFDVDGILRKKVVVVVGMGKDVELPETVSPLLRSMCCGWVGKEEGDVNETCCKNGFCAFDVLGVVDQNG